MNGLLAGFDTGHAIVAASDASVHQSGRLAGLAYITSAGRWHASAWTVQPCQAPITSGLAELRAAALLLTDAGIPDLLLTDSVETVGYLQAWQRGEWCAPPSWQPRLERGRVLLLRAAFEAAAANPGIEVRHVYGHRGHLLNEAADSLARIAMRGGGSRREKKTRSAGLVASFLTSWQETPDTTPPGCPTATVYATAK